MKETINKALHQIDIFGQNITLNMNSQAYYTTKFGGASSMLIIIVVILFFFSNIIDCLDKTLVFTNSQVVFSDDPELLVLNQENFMMAFAISQNNFLTHPFFNISVTLRHYNRTESGELKKITTYLQLQQCKLEQFDQVFSKHGINFTDQFHSLGLSNWLCPVDNYQINLKGTYSSKDFEHVKIYVSDCKNTTDLNQSWRPVCADNETIRSQLNIDGQFKLQMYFTNAIINPNQPSDYLQYYLDSDMYFTFVPKKLSRQANIYFRENKVITDQSLLPFEQNQIENVVSRKSDDYRDLTELGRDTDDLYAVIYLRKSPFQEQINRSFLKIGALLSYLGGVLQIMKLAFGLFIALYNRQIMLIELLNKLYDFRDQNQNDPDSCRPFMMLNTNRSKIVEDQRPHDDMDLVLNGKGQESRATLPYMQKDIKTAVNALLEDPYPIKFNFRLFLNMMSCGLLFKDKNSIFLHQGIKRMNEDLDLLSILYKIQEISKLKNVLLNQQQLMLFNFTPKPQIQLNQNVDRLLHQNRSQQIRNYKINYEEKTKLISRISEAYETVNDDIQFEEEIDCQFRVNHKLIELFYQETNNINQSNRFSSLMPSPKVQIQKFNNQIAKYKIPNQTYTLNQLDDGQNQNNDQNV